jgi:hypothetical protein
MRIASEELCFGPGGTSRKNSRQRFGEFALAGQEASSGSRRNSSRSFRSSYREATVQMCCLKQLAEQMLDAL